MESYYKSESLYYSILFGKGVYKDTCARIADPMSVSVKNRQYSPLVKKIDTNENFFLRSFPKKYLVHYEKMIWYPPMSRNIVWPVDIVELNSEQQKQCEVSVGQTYNDQNIAETEKNQYALVFADSSRMQCINLTSKLKEIGILSWKNKQLQKIMAELVDAIRKLNQNGYIFLDFHCSNYHTCPIFISKNGSVIFNFTNMLFSQSDFDVDGIERGEYPVEFMEPAFVNGYQKSLDEHSQNYSLAAFLFYLCFDRYAYDGSYLHVQIQDDSIQNHYVKFLDYYYENPVFIFDPTNTENEIKDIFQSDRELRQSWQECPDWMKDCFLRSLGKEKKDLRNEQQIPTPEDWWQCFKSSKWI